MNCHRHSPRRVDSAAAGSRCHLPKPRKIIAVNVYPPDINLSTKLDSQRFLVVATREDGVTLDVTQLAASNWPIQSSAELDKHILYSAGRRSNQRSTSNIRACRPRRRSRVKDAAADRPISFQLDVMPVFMRGGCNTGSCHGAARGKDGFRLSLFGYDPHGDYFRITRELGFRRINLASPAR